MEALSGFVVGNNRSGSTLDQEASQPVAVVGGIGGQGSGLGQVSDQGKRRADIAQLTGGHVEGQRLSASICYDVDFSRAATA